MNAPKMVKFEKIPQHDGPKHLATKVNRRPWWKKLLGIK